MDYKWQVYWFVLSCITPGIFTNAGVKPNIIPEMASLHYYLRAPTKAEVEELKRKVEGCIQGAAMATGCQVCSLYTYYFP